MAGKSTLLRQTALIAILAQIGSFVPADHAEIGIVDAIFSRVGANDDLFRNRSTFMVEMMETADILNKATPHSLVRTSIASLGVAMSDSGLQVIMDEVGRGTSVQDGLAIAFSTIHHLITVNKSRALFATHFHELADMLGCQDGDRGSGIFDAARFYCTDVDETEVSSQPFRAKTLLIDYFQDGYFAYSHRLRPGVNRDSHALKVAQLAGMPPLALGIARTALHAFRDANKAILLKDSLKLQSLGQSLTHASS